MAWTGAQFGLHYHVMVQRAVRLTFWCRITAFSAVVLGLYAFAAPAHARLFFGFGFPFYFGAPAYYPPPVYYPSPAYYPPPPYYSAPPVTYASQPPQPAAPAGQSCYAGAYVCPMEHAVPTGSACYCLSNNRAHIPGRAG